MSAFRGRLSGLDVDCGIVLGVNELVEEDVVLFACCGLTLPDTLFKLA